MQFSKWHALGNSYLVAEQPQAGPLTPNRVQRLCSASVGIGSDGLVEVTGREGATAVVKIWNPDGSTAEMSGNGVRIAARWLAAETGATHVTIETAGRRIAARMLNALDTETDVGEFDVGAAETLDGVELNPVSVGNPHAVIRLHDPTRDDLLRLGPFVETHSRFPDRTNVQLVRVDGRHDLTVLVGSVAQGRRPPPARRRSQRLRWPSNAGGATERSRCISLVGTCTWKSRQAGHRSRGPPNASPGAARSCDPRDPAPLDRLGSDAPERPRAS